ncbi:hypothetical protein [Paenibacillus sp. Root52]|nr:hypothetical protein [Paenibacillus sp. Root52]
MMNDLLAQLRTDKQEARSLSDVMTDGFVNWTNELRRQVGSKSNQI